MSGSSNWTFVSNARSVPYNPWNTGFTDHFSTRFLYTRHFWPTLWLVISCKCLCSPLRIVLCLISQYNSGISHMTYVYLALPYKSNAGGCTSCGWQSRCSSRPFVYEENNVSLKYYCDRYQNLFFITSQLCI